MPIAPVYGSQTTFYPSNRQPTSYAPNVSQSSGYTVIVQPGANPTSIYPAENIPTTSVPPPVPIQRPIPGPMPLPSTAASMPAPAPMTTAPEIDQVAASMSSMNINADGNAAQMYPPTPNTVPSMNPPSPARNGTTGQSTVISVYPPGAPQNPIGPTGQPTVMSAYPPSPAQNPIGTTAQNTATSLYPPNVPQNPVGQTGQTTVTSVIPPSAPQNPTTTAGQTTMTSVYPPGAPQNPAATTGQTTLTPVYAPNAAPSPQPAQVANIGQSSVPTPTAIPTSMTTPAYAPPAPTSTPVPAPTTYNQASPDSSTYSSPYSTPAAQELPMSTGTRRSHRSYEPETYHRSTGRSQSHSRAIHRSDLDDMARDAPRSTRAVEESVTMPPDYVPASPSPERVSGGTRHRRTVSATSPTPISTSRSRSHGSHGVPSLGHNDSLTLPYVEGVSQSRHHRHSSPHHHHHHHDEHRHSPHHRDYAYAPSKHRSSSQAPRVHYEVQPVRPTYTRHRSRSVDAGNPRMTRSRLNETYPAQAQAQPQYYTQQPGTQAAPMNPARNYHVIHPSSAAPTVIQHSTYQPVTAPMSNGRNGYAVPPPGQSVRVAHGHRHDPRGVERDTRAAQPTSPPGFFGRIFGSRAQPTTNVAGQTAGMQPRGNAGYQYGTSQPMQYGTSQPMQYDTSQPVQYVNTYR